MLEYMARYIIKRFTDMYDHKQASKVNKKISKILCITKYVVYS